MRLMRLALTLCLVAFFELPGGAKAGVIGDFVEGVGKATGIKPIEDLGRKGDEEHKRVKKKVKVYGDIEEGASRAVRETGQWIEENPDKAIAIAAIVAVGWAACADGCQLVGAILTSGVAIPVAAMDVGGEENSTGNDAPPPSTGSIAPNEESAAPSSTPESDEDESEQGDDGDDQLGLGFEPKIEKEYPRGYSKVEFPDGPPPILKYKSARDDLGQVFNEFSLATKNGVIRYPGASDAGGVLESGRTAKADPEFEPEARRVHGGIDYLTFPGDPVLAPMTGTVEAVGPMESDKSGLGIVQIVADDGTRARVLYVQGSEDIKVGGRVSAGQEIGHAQNIGGSYDLTTTPNHVHVDYQDFQGRKFDPFTNKIIRPKEALPGGG